MKYMTYTPKSVNVDPSLLPKMKPEYKKRWLEALRSDKYEQGTGVLRTSSDEFCCLGVLCDIVKKDLDLEWFDDADDASGWFFDGVDTDVPLSVGELAFENWPKHSFTEETLSPLILRNDGSMTHKLSSHNFKQIADIVEEYM